ncbi:MAG TPA: LLM class F420-dependent oxidoreductase [Ktedonobacterales bacterium]|nr:LLM class F420-dependent oxidoreductase [Ktedonobacterales bacterium]
MAIRFGVFVPQGWRMDLVGIADPIEKYEAMTRVAKAADAIPAIDSIWVYDHFHTVPKPSMETTFECWTITAALARDTTRVKIGQMVTCNGYRHPALLAKMASTVDVLSHGRLYCGLGAGWYEHEWRAYGYGFPETRERMRMFREACEIITKMWTEDKPTFQGEHYSIDQPINEPKGARKPHPSFWIGGSGEQVTLKLVARFADACNIGGDPDVAEHKLAVLRQHCETVGRDYDSIIKSTSIEDIVLVRQGETPEAAVERAHSAMDADFVGTAVELADRLRALAERGIDYVIVSFPRLAYDLEPLHRFADEVVPLVND